MSDQITLEEALELVSFHHVTGCGWRVLEVCNNVWGDVGGNVWGNVGGDVVGTVWGDVCGDVHGTINGREWKSVETPKEKFQRLLQGTHNQELIDAFNQLEDN